MPQLRCASGALGVLLVATLLSACGTTVPLGQQQQQPDGPAGPVGGGSTGTTGSTGQGPLGAGGSSAGSGLTSGGTSGAASDGHGAPSSSGGSRGGANPPSTTDGGSTPGATGIPRKGFGWDDKHAYLGIPYQDSSATNTAANGLGLKGLVAIDYRQASRAVLADINKHGGLFGRTVEPVFANFPPLPNQTGESQCATWTQDNSVFSVVDTFYGTDAEFACLAKAHVPFGDGIIAVMTDGILNKYAPYAHKLHVTSTTKLEPTMLTRLKANGFFQGWDTLKGAPGKAQVKTGVFCRVDTEAQRNECSEMGALLKRRGFDVAATYTESGAGNDSSSGAVLKFKAAGVTHVFCATTDLLFFMNNADSQAYYPRYAVSSLDAPFLLASNAPAKQLHGAMGVGFSPFNDVAKPPPLTAQQRHCLKILRDGGLDVPSAPSAQMLAQNICDQITLWVDAARLGGGLDPVHVLAGLDHLQGTYTPGTVFASGLSSTRHDEAAAVRDLAWNEDCACFAYLRSTNWPT